MKTLLKMPMFDLKLSQTTQDPIPASWKKAAGLLKSKSVALKKHAHNIRKELSR